MSRRQELAARRVVLVARCEHQRRELGTASEGVAHSLRAVDTAVRVVRRATAHPVILAGMAVAAIVIIRPRRLLQFVAWGSSAAITARRVSNLLRPAA